MATWHPPRRTLLLALAAALALHALALPLARRAWRPPSVLRTMRATFYTRQLAPQAPAAQPVAPTAAAAAPQRRTHLAATAPQSKTKKTPHDKAPQNVTPGAAPEQPASAPKTARTQRTPKKAPSAPPKPAAPARTPASSAASATKAASAAQPAAPAASAPAADTAYLAQWPGDTRLTYQLGGWYRGELHGSAQVLWQRDGANYQAVIAMDVGLLLHMRMSSQGSITKGGLRPRVYEEQIRDKRRNVRIDAGGVRLANGEKVPIPGAVQDTASQLVELAQRFASGRERLAAGRRISLWLARTASVQRWHYEVLGEETLHLPRMGAVRAWHLRPLPPPGKQIHGIQAELWFAPALQYLPVRILITQERDGETRTIDLMVKTIDQREGQTAVKQ